MAKKKAIKKVTKKKVAPKKATAPKKAVAKKVAKKVTKSKTTFVATSTSPEFSEGTEIKVSEQMGMKMVKIGWAKIK